MPAQVPQFHSLYNSQLSVSQRNKLVRPIENKSSTSWNGVEIGVYTVLCVLGLLMAAFSTACFVFAIKQKSTNSSPEFTTVTTVKPNDQDPSFNGGNGYLNATPSRLNKMLNEWPWLQQQADKFNKTNDQPDGQPATKTNRVSLRLNPFDEEETGQEVAADRVGEAWSIQITANPIVNALENAVSSALNRANGDEKSKRIAEEAATPEPDLQEIKNMLNYCKSIPPAGATQLNGASKSANGHRKQPPPIPARKNRQTNSATFVRGKRAPNQQLPVHVPGIACRTLNAVNVQANSRPIDASSDSSNDSSLTNSINSSPINSSNKNSDKNFEIIPGKTSPVNLSPSSSLDSGMPNSQSESPVAEQKHLITNPFLNYPEETRSFSREPPAYSQPAELNEPAEEQIYVNTTSPPVPPHSSQRQRTRIIPPKSLFDEMNYKEILNYMETMEESTA